MINPASREAEPDASQTVVSQLIGRGKRVLEIGVGRGELSHRLAAAGNHITALDRDAHAIDAARGWCQEALVVDLDATRLGDAIHADAFDVALTGDALERLRDPWLVLSDARALLSPTGFLIVSIPNVAHGNTRLSLLSGSFGGAKIQLLDPSHLRFFTLRSIRELLLRAGYRIDAVERVAAPLFAGTTLHERDFSAEVLDEIRRDPEHATSHFVLRATPVSGNDHLGIALDALSELETSYAAAAAGLARLERQLADERGAAERLAEAEVQLGEREAELKRERIVTRELREQVARLEKEVASAEFEAASEAGDERAAMRDELTALRAREERREEALAEAREEASRLREELTAASRSSGEASALRIAVDRAHESLASLHESMQAKIASNEEELARLRATSSQASLETAAFRRALDELRYDYDALHRTLGETESARATLAARFADLEELARKREAAAAETVAELRRSLATRQRDLAPASPVLSALELRGISAPAPPAATVDALGRLDVELQRVQAAQKTTVEAFARHIDADINMVRAEMAEIDALIRGIHASRVWSLKGKLRAVRRRLLARGR